jgi:hypothetical protein
LTDFNNLHIDIALAKLETEKRNSLIKAWEENEKTKAENKYAASFYSHRAHLFALVTRNTSSQEYYFLIQFVVRAKLFFEYLNA